MAKIAAALAWQPIESLTPSNGQILLVACKGYRGTDYVVSAYYSEDERGWWEVNTHSTDQTDGRVHPTHWMHLPAPPKD